MRRKLPGIEETDVVGKAVWVRVDLDVSDLDNPRVESAMNVVSKIKGLGASRILAMGHKGDINVTEELAKRLPFAQWDDSLRDNAGENENSKEYARQLVEGFDIYVNETFAVSHREHASIVAVPQVMKTTGRKAVFGPRFVKEVERLDEVLARQGKRVLALGGTKATDKVGYARALAGKFERVLVGGRLPMFMQESERPEIVLGKLRADGLDLNEETIVKFTQEILSADLVVAAGPMGKYEDEGSSDGTKRVLLAVCDSHAEKIAGGGDIEAAISKFGLDDRFDWISVGGGAMLQYLDKETLVGIEAIVD